MKHTLTHRGWFGLCPVNLGDLHTESPLVFPRWAVLGPLLSLSIVIFDLVIDAMEFCGGENPGYPIAITAELPTPLVVELPEGGA